MVSSSQTSPHYTRSYYCFWCPSLSSSLKLKNDRSLGAACSPVTKKGDTSTFFLDGQRYKNSIYRKQIDDAGKAQRMQRRKHPDEWEWLSWYGTSFQTLLQTASKALRPPKNNGMLLESLLTKKSYWTTAHLMAAGKSLCTVGACLDWEKKNYQGVAKLNFSPCALWMVEW